MCCRFAEKDVREAVSLRLKPRALRMAFRSASARSAHISCNRLGMDMQGLYGKKGVCQMSTGIKKPAVWLALIAGKLVFGGKRITIILVQLKV